MLSSNNPIPFSFTQQAIKEFLSQNSLDNNYLGKGGYRKVFKYSDTMVVKVPTDTAYYLGGIVSNFKEFLFYQNHPNKPLAKCELIFHKGIPILFMEKVNPLARTWYTDGFDKKYPEEHSFFKNILDGIQVGINSKNEVKCYDYGSEDSFLWYNSLHTDLMNLFIKAWVDIFENKEFYQIPPDENLFIEYALEKYDLNKEYVPKDLDKKVSNIKDLLNECYPEEFKPNVLAPIIDYPNNIRQTIIKKHSRAMYSPIVWQDMANQTPQFNPVFEPIYLNKQV